MAITARGPLILGNVYGTGYTPTSCCDVSVSQKQLNTRVDGAASTPVEVVFDQKVSHNAILKHAFRFFPQPFFIVAPSLTELYM